MSKNFFSMVGIAAVTSLVTFAAAKKFIYNDTPLPNEVGISGMVKNASYAPSSTGGYTNLEFAADKGSKAVVHIKVNTNAQVVENQNPFGGSIFDQFFGGGRQYIPPTQSSGSGVIISSDGYIITNNHVVENASELKVTLNDRQEYVANVVGKDPSTDLALLKIDKKNLSFLQYANSDAVKLGEWVLAVGYPLNLETTVTAGIISAKSRSIGINNRKSEMPIENFLQTDAAVNPGNSGGALVNANGDLIGINSAIASPTGSYAGYSYAIPSNLVKKVVEDLMKYGNVQRGFIGITPLDLKAATPEQVSAYGLDKVDGVYVERVSPDGGARKAGIAAGDFITKINGSAVKTTSQLLEMVGRQRPGDKLDVTYIRNGAIKNAQVELKNINGNTAIVKNEFTSKLGATLKPLSKEDSKKLGITGGLLVSSAGNGVLGTRTKIKNGFVITEANDVNITSLEKFNEVVSNSDGKVQLAGLYPGYQGVYYYEVDLN
jgi:serine protease Do